MFEEKERGLGCLLLAVSQAIRSLHSQLIEAPFDLNIEQIALLYHLFERGSARKNELAVGVGILDSKELDGVLESLINAGLVIEKDHFITISGYGTEVFSKILPQINQGTQSILKNFNESEQQLLTIYLKRICVNCNPTQ